MNATRRTILPSLLVTAVAFQTTDLSRIVYTKLSLAPNCPIVGHNRHCRVVSSYHGEGLIEHKETKPTRHPARPAPAPRGKECPTCKMLGLSHTFAFAKSAATQFILTPTRLEPVDHRTLEHFDTANQAHARAPPKAEWVL